MAKKILRTLLIIVCVIVVLLLLCACISFAGIRSNQRFIKTIPATEYAHQLVPEIADDGYYTFTTDNDFKILDLTDIHIGGGFLSKNKDSMALNAVAAMVISERPDLVIVTGDIAYPIPYQAGTINNKSSAMLFAKLMEQLGVYWCPVFGNHDTEVFAYHSRKSIANFYSKDKYPHCLFQSGPEDVDGYGNYIVNIKNSKGEITQSLVLLDSHSYVGNSVLGGALWNYDYIHENQIEWYKDSINSLTEENNGKTPKSLAFFHIPLVEYKDAWFEYTENSNKDTENVKYIYGTIGEQEPYVFSSKTNSGFFDTALELGSTQGMFCGHDHLNNFSLDYKGIRLTYGYSVDYLAYKGISKYGSQRGCTVITVSPDGSFDCVGENYYQAKYLSPKEKEEVTMEDYYSEY